MMEQELLTFYQTVHGLKLRILGTPQATPEIRAEAEQIATSLPFLLKKIQAQKGNAQAEYVQQELERIKTELHQLFAEKLNPLMGAQPIETKTIETKNPA